ncbi:hypothetical protein BER93_16035 [Xanthomonas fragariae]|nr:hypothetical protein BER92_15990 [Xanthomonas fragariae]AOD19351.1 hypothetical protein BER93_16035 [Xanthomonas fragariae]
MRTLRWVAVQWRMHVARHTRTGRDHLRENVSRNALGATLALRFTAVATAAGLFVKQDRRAPPLGAAHPDAWRIQPRSDRHDSGGQAAA